VEEDEALSSRAPWPRWNNPRITLYHGTVRPFAHRILEDGVDVFTGRAEVDFGQGFYTTTSLEQAETWARLKSQRTNELPAIVRLRLDRLELRNLRSLVFVHVDEYSGDYWSFVEHCRRGNQMPPVTSEHDDVVYGPVAFRWGPDARLNRGLIKSVSTDLVLRIFCGILGVARLRF